MPFQSILYAEADAGASEERQEPSCFADLNLDQVVDAITAGKEEYDLKPLFYTLLPSSAAVRYRQAVMQDLEDPVLREQIERFAQAMRSRREQEALAARLYHRWQKARWFVDAADVYCQAVVGLAEGLAGVEVRSEGLSGLRSYLAQYVRSQPFLNLWEETKQVLAALGTVQYCLQIKGNTVKVRAWAGEDDLSAAVQRVFAKFSHTAEHDYRIHFAGAPEANAVEGQILERVALLFPPVFDELQAFCDRNCSYLEPAIARFEQEVQFYLACLAYVARFRRRGLPLCYPDVQMADKASFCEDAYDFALACKLDLQNVQVVCNDFHLEGSERILVITGPNQGGKTTFARAFGQVYYLGSLGCPVAGRAARLFLCDRILTHFEAEEHVADLRSKLEDDLLRLRKLLALATPRSIIILNEVLSSTSLHDALYLGRRMMARLSALDALCVYVTFLDELAGFDDKTVSMVSTVGGEDLALRTYKLVRKEADGLAYAHSLALKHRLTYAGIKERIKA